MIRRPRFPGHAVRSIEARRQERFAWLTVLEQATRLGDAVALGQTLDAMAAGEFRHHLVRATQLAFPLPYASAAAAAQGFAHLARGFDAAAVPELKQALARAMTAAARCCRRLIELDDQTRAADALADHQRRTGEKD